MKWGRAPVAVAVEMEVSVLLQGSSQGLWIGQARLDGSRAASEFSIFEALPASMNKGSLSKKGQLARIQAVLVS